MRARTGDCASRPSRTASAERTRRVPRLTLSCSSAALLLTASTLVTTDSSPDRLHLDRQRQGRDEPGPVFLLQRRVPRPRRRHGELLAPER